MATEPPTPPNPYAPSDALAHEAADEAASTRLAQPSRFGALVLTFFAYPLMGAGLYNLRRPRRFAVWAVIGGLVWLLAVIGIRASLPKLAVAALAAMVVTLLSSLADTAFAKVGGARIVARPWLMALVLVVAGKGAGLVSRLWLIEAFQMPSGSMVPTLLVGDHMFVKKGRADVARGDVIVFAFPPDPRIDYIKRVVAVGGDTVEVRNGVPMINGSPLDHQPLEAPCSYHDDAPSPGDAEQEPCTLVRESNAGRAYTIMLTSDRPAQDFPRFHVPPGELFVLGDNRDNSYDSRRWGTVPIDRVKGIATVVWWSRGAGITGIRWSRVGHGIE